VHAPHNGSAQTGGSAPLEVDVDRGLTSEGAAELLRLHRPNALPHCQARLAPRPSSLRRQLEDSLVHELTTAVGLMELEPNRARAWHPGDGASFGADVGTRGHWSASVMGGGFRA
jgi:hypothetical protein